MRWRFLLCVPFLLLGCGIALFLIQDQRTQVSRLVDYLPVDTIALAVGENIPATLEWLRQTPVGTMALAADTPQLLKQLGVAASVRVRYAEGCKAFNLLRTDPGLIRFLDRRAVVALLPDDKGKISPGALPDHVVVLLYRPRGDTPRISFETSFGPVRGSEVASYRGQSVTTMAFDQGRAVSCTHFSSGVLACALTEGMVQRCIDQSLQLMRAPESGLRAAAEYRRLREMAGDESDLFVYVNRPALLREFSGQERNTQSEAGGLHHVGLYCRVREAKGRVGGAVLVQPERVRHWEQWLEFNPPVVAPLFQQVREDVEFSFWTNLFRADAAWRFFLSQSSPELHAVLVMLGQGLIDASGHTEASFFSIFGSELGLRMQSQEVPGQSPHFHSCLTVSIRDRGRAEHLMRTLTAPLQKVSVPGPWGDVVSLVLANGLLKPAYLLTDDRLILADHVELITGFHDFYPPAGNRKTSSASSAQTGNVFVHMQTSTLAERWKPVLALLARETSGSANLFSLQSRLILRRILVPMLDGMGHVGASSFRGSVFPDAVQGELDYTVRATEIP